MWANHDMKYTQTNIHYYTEITTDTTCQPANKMLYQHLPSACVPAGMITQRQPQTKTLTSGIHHGQHDGWDPRHLAVGGIEDLLDVLEEDSDGLGEGIGEADGDERSQHHDPPPASVWRGHGGGTCGGGRHHWSGSTLTVHCKSRGGREKEGEQVSNGPVTIH